MLPRERVYRTLAQEEPDPVPRGEHLVDFTVIQLSNRRLQAEVESAILVW